MRARFRGLYFHDSGLVGARFHSGLLRLEFENVVDRAEVFVDVTVEVPGVTRCDEDDAANVKSRTEGLWRWPSDRCDGDVLEFGVVDQGLELLVEWNEYEHIPAWHTTVYYVFHCDASLAKVTVKPAADPPQ